MQRPEPCRRRQRVGAARIHAVGHQQAAAAGVAAALELGVTEPECGRDVRAAAARHRQHAADQALPERHLLIEARDETGVVGEQLHSEVAGPQLEGEHGRRHRGEAIFSPAMLSEVSTMSTTW